jgi:hypothetical protein
MSIIHDALKKIQLTDRIETLPRVGQQTADRKSPTQNKIKSIFALGCAVVIAAASILYVYQQFQSNIPKIKNFAKKSFYQLIHKEELPAFKTKAPEDLVPLAKITVAPPKPSISTNAPIPTNLPAIADTPKINAPVTLNIHGVMSNDTGNVALINDQIYQEGDTVDGVKIVKISLDSVTVINNGKKEIIPVKN